MVSSECQPHLACVNQKCENPCGDTCAKNANCNVINHSPICVCKQGLTGNPFTSCYPIKSKYRNIVLRNYKSSHRFFYWPRDQTSYFITKQRENEIASNKLIRLFYNANYIFYRKRQVKINNYLNVSFLVIHCHLIY